MLAGESVRQLDLERRAMLARVASADREAFALDRLLEVVAEDGSTYFAADYGTETGPHFPQPTPEGLRALLLAGVRELPVREVRIAGALDRGATRAEVKRFFHAPALRGVERVCATGVRVQRAEDIAASPVLEGLRDLDLSVSSANLGALATSVSLGRLERLSALQARASATDIVALLASPALPKLTRLEIGNEVLAADGQTFAGASELSRLVTLRVPGSGRPPPEVWRALLSRSDLASLRELELGPWPADPSAALVLSGAGRFDALEVLELGVGPAAAIELALPALRELRLHGLDDPALSTLGRQSGLAQLTRLDLGLAPGASAQAFAALAGADLSGLQTLVVRATHADDRLTRAVCSVLATSGARHVALSGLVWSDGALDALLDALAAGRIEYLSLDTALGEAAGARLAACDGLANLRCLELAFPKLGEGVRELLGAPGLAQLQALELTNDALDERACRVLLDRDWPDLVDLRVTLRPNVTIEARRALAAHARMPALWTLLGMQLPEPVADLRTHVEAPTRVLRQLPRRPRVSPDPVASPLE